MNDRKVLAVLIKAGDTALDRPLGVGALVDRQAAFLVLDENAELGTLAVLELLITPVPLGDGDFVERIRLAAMMTGSLAGGNGEQLAMVRLRYASVHGGDGAAFSRADLRQALETDQDGWLAMQRLAGIGERLSDVEITKALENAKASEEGYSARRLERKGERTAAQIADDCCHCSSACHEPS